MVCLALFSCIAGCDESTTGNEIPLPEIDLINDQFAESQSEIQEVLDGIFKSIQDNEADKLISYHAYSAKFTEFRDSEPRYNSQENEDYERAFVGAISGFEYELGEKKIAVYGDVAVVTFHADFRPTIGQDVLQIWGSTTLVFVKTDEGWKIVHEHHSPLNVD